MRGVYAARRRLADMMIVGYAAMLRATHAVGCLGPAAATNASVCALAVAAAAASMTIGGKWGAITGSALGAWISASPSVFDIAEDMPAPLRLAA